MEIIVADDECVIRQSLAKLLKVNGYSVRAAKNVEEALRLYRERTPDLMLLDVMMPKGNGYEICETIRKTDVETPVLFLTALDSDTDELRGLDAGADSIFRRRFQMKSSLHGSPRRSAGTGTTNRRAILTLRTGMSIRRSCRCDGIQAMPSRSASARWRCCGGLSRIRTRSFRGISSSPSFGMCRLVEMLGFSRPNLRICVTDCSRACGGCDNCDGKVSPALVEGAVARLAG